MFSLFIPLSVLAICTISCANLVKRQDASFSFARYSSRTAQIKVILSSEDYDTNVPPPTTNGPITIEFVFDVTSLHSLDEQTQLLQVTVEIEQRWVDSRLLGNESSVFSEIDEPAVILQDQNDVDAIWKPKYAFPSQQTATLDRIVISVYSNGTVTALETWTLALSCPMDFSRFPFDVQICAFHCESYYNIGLVNFDWSMENGTSEYLMSGNYANLAKFRFSRWYIKKSNSVYPHFRDSTGYSRLSIFFVFERQLLFYFVEGFLPGMLIISVSWGAFWIDPSVVNSRVGLGVTTMLTIFAMGQYVKSTLPQVSVLKALDIWIFACEFFVVLALIESIVAYRIFKDGKDKLEDGKTDKGTADKIAKIAFPCCFFLFAIAYGLYFGLSQAELK